MRQQGSLINYRYDALDRLIGVAPRDASASTYIYREGQIATQLTEDGHHSRVQIGHHLLAQTSRVGDTVVNTLLGTDRQRSVLQGVTGNDIQHRAYSPYGELCYEAGAANLPGFNGEQPDPLTGCYLLGNGYRAYNPVLMRFHSPDSLSPFESGGINPYAYCMGDPVNRSDPTGHFSWKSLLSIAIAAASIAISVGTLGSGIPLASPLILGLRLGIASDVSSIFGTLANELAPKSHAGTVLGVLSIGLAGVTAAVPHLAKRAASSAAREAGRSFVPAPVSVTRQGAFKGQPLKKPSGTTGLGKGSRNTVALQNRLEQIQNGFGYVEYAGYIVKSQDFAEKTVRPYFTPAPGNTTDQPTTALDALQQDDGAQGGGVQKVRDFLTRDQRVIQSIRES